MSNQFEPSFDEPSRESGTPLTDFWGTGAGWGIKNAGKTDYKIMVFRFAGPSFKVVASTVPYVHETAELEIFYSDPKTTFKRQTNKGINEWTAYSDSVREIFPDNLSPTEILNDMFGGRVELAPEGQVPSKPGRLMHWAKVPTLMSAKDPSDESGKKYTDQMLGAWKVVEVEGIGKIAVPNADGTVPATNGNGALEIMAYALDLANGLTEVDFYAKAMDDMKLVNNPGITKQLIDRAWVQQMISMGQLKNVDGVLVRA